jgi:DNA repair protein RadC
MYRITKRENKTFILLFRRNHKIMLNFDICKLMGNFMEGKKRAIKDWATDDRPREKLMVKGAAALSDSELLAILLRYGYEKTDAVILSREILSTCQDSLLELGRLSVKDLMKIKGIGLAKAATLVAALELARRWYSRKATHYPVVKDSRDAEGYLRPLLEHYTYEVFGILFLAQSGRIIQDFERISEGGITSTTVDPRRIFRRALEAGAVSIIVAHNHPSGSARPSKADEALTQKIMLGSKFLDIKLLDHIIIAREGYFSFADEKLLAA